MVREALFQLLDNRLQGEWKGVRVLDLFAGTGSLGLEALSRGAAEALFLELDPACLKIIRENLALAGFPRQGRCLRLDLNRRSSLDRLNGPFRLIMADPPYGRGLGERILTSVFKAGILSHDGLLVIEERRGESLPGILFQGELTLSLEELRVYGDTQLLFYHYGDPKGMIDENSSLSRHL